MDAAVLEQNHWKSPAPSPSHRIALPLRQSSPSRSHHHDSTLHEETSVGYGPIQSHATKMDDINKSHSRRRKSQSSFEKEEVSSSQMPEWERGEVGEDYKHSITAQASLHIPRRLSQPDSRELGTGDSSSEEEVTDDEEAGLTNADGIKRRRRKRRQRALDERVASNTKISRKERKLADMSVLKKSAINAMLIGLWYLFSLSISIYNKWMFSPEHLNFHFPLFTTSLHMLVQFCLASTILFCFPHFRPRLDSISNPHNLSKPTENEEPSTTKKPLMTAKFYLSRIAPCGTATGLDIGLGNMSLKFITLTFFTMCKSSALAFVLLFAFIFHLETPSIKLILIIATMTIGVVMMVAGETAFNVLGFVLIISSAFFSGFRWALTQILLLRNPATSNPFSSIFFLAPIMFLSLAILALPIEGLGQIKEGIQGLIATKGTPLGVVMLLFPGVLAFCMTASEFALLQRTSVVTLSICGIFKEVITISAAGIVFHDPLTPINVSGLLVTIASIAAYNYIKITKMRKEAREKVQEDAHGTEAEQMLDGEEVREAPQERTSTGSGVIEAVRSSLTLIPPARDGAGAEGKRSSTDGAAER